MPGELGESHSSAELTPIQRVYDETPPLDPVALVSGSECKGELALVMVYL